jgi:hypothetical protein
LQDIECAGGIASNFSLKAICDSKQDIYDKPNSSEQHMVWNTINKWKHHWTCADYYALLASLGIQPHEAIQVQGAHEAFSLVSNHQPSPESLPKMTKDSSKHSFDSLSLTSTPLIRTPTCGAQRMIRRMAHLDSLDNDEGK